MLLITNTLNHKRLYKNVKGWRIWQHTCTCASKSGNWLHAESWLKVKCHRCSTTFPYVQQWQLYLPRHFHTSMCAYVFHTERARKLKGKNRCWVARPHSQRMWHLTFHQIEPFRSSSCLWEVRGIDKTPALTLAFQTCQKTPASTGQRGRTVGIQYKTPLAEHIEKKETPSTKITHR